MYMYVEMLMTFVVLTVPFGLMLLRKNRGVYEYMACGGNELKKFRYYWLKCMNVLTQFAISS